MNTNDEWYSQYAAYQEKWPCDSLPACKDLTSVREPVEIVTFAQISTHCHLTVFPEMPLSHWRSPLNQISDPFPRGHDPITHARTSRRLAQVGSIFNECCHCHCHGEMCQTLRILRKCVCVCVCVRGFLDILPEAEVACVAQCVEADDESFCRICFVTGSESTEPLVRPCACTGSMGHVHSRCLLSWIEQTSGVARCEVCRSTIRTRTQWGRSRGASLSFKSMWMVPTHCGDVCRTTFVACLDLPACAEPLLLLECGQIASRIIHCN